jgi:hypothetical protein
MDPDAGPQTVDFGGEHPMIDARSANWRIPHKRLHELHY